MMVVGRMSLSGSGVGIGGEGVGASGERGHHPVSGM